VLGSLAALHRLVRNQDIPQQEVISIYVKLSELALGNMSFKMTAAVEGSLPAAKRARTEQFMVGNNGYVSPIENRVTCEAMLAYVSSLLEFEFEGHLESLVQKITAEAKQITGEEFNRLWIPFLQGMVPILENHQVPLSSPRWQQVYTGLLQAYLVNYVQEPPPKQPVSSDQVNCICRDCKELNKFLGNPNQRVGRFPVGKGRRAHLHQQLDIARINCSHETERNGNPQTLIVTKRATRYELACAAWKERKHEAEVQMQAFDEGKLRALLDERYESIMAGRVVAGKVVEVIALSP
jgi:hypothetical protein